jgi:hypothetical protein
MRSFNSLMLITSLIVLLFVLRSLALASWKELFADLAKVYIFLICYSTQWLKIHLR